MQPRTTMKFDRQSFSRLSKTIGNMAKGVRQRRTDPGYAVPIPTDIGIQLTRKCNLRCKTCFLWNEDGAFRNLSGDKKNLELNVAVIKNMLQATRKAKSNLYIWGAEPLVHSRWEDVAHLLERDPRWTVICTNGILIDKYIDSLLRISENLAIVVSLDGFKDEHDAVRGKGTFAHSTENVQQILTLKKKGEYKGEISLHCVLNEYIAPKLYEFLEYAETLGVNTLYFGFPWYIPEAVGKRMDDYYRREFSWLRPLGQKPSWYHYSYYLEPAYIDVIKEQFAKINCREWKIRVRLQPALELDEIEGYILGSEEQAQKRTQCLAVCNRMDILADGNVTACQPFAEFSIGNLYERDLLDIWNSEAYTRTRKIISKGLTPICSKCILLYLNGK